MRLCDLEWYPAGAVKWANFPGGVIWEFRNDARGVYYTVAPSNHSIYPYYYFHLDALSAQAIICELERGNPEGNDAVQEP